MSTFPSAVASKPLNITANQTILADHVSLLWDEVIATEEALLGSATVNLRVRRDNAGDQAVGVRRTLDTHERLSVTAGGDLTFGSGSAAGDVTLGRGGTRTLGLAGNAALTSQASGDVPLRITGAASQVTLVELLNSSSTAVLTVSGGGAVTCTAATVNGALSAGTTTLGTTGTGALTATTLTAGNTTLTGTLGVTGATTLSSVGTSGNATVGGTLTVTGASTLGVTATGATTAASLTVTGSTTLAATAATTIAASGNTTVGGTLGVTGATTLAAVGATSAAVSGNATVGGTLGVTGATTLGVVGTGNATVTGTLNVSGATTLAAVSATSAAVSGTTTIGGDATTNLYREAAGRLRTDGALRGDLITRTKSGAPADGDYAATPPDGALVADVLTEQLYVRMNGAWKGLRPEYTEFFMMMGA